MSRENLYTNEVKEFLDSLAKIDYQVCEWAVGQWIAGLTIEEIKAKFRDLVTGER